MINQCDDFNPMTDRQRHLFYLHPIIFGGTANPLICPDDHSAAFVPVGSKDEKQCNR